MTLLWTSSAILLISKTYNQWILAKLKVRHQHTLIQNMTESRLVFSAGLFSPFEIEDYPVQSCYK